MRRSNLDCMSLGSKLLHVDWPHSTLVPIAGRSSHICIVLIVFTVLHDCCDTLVLILLYPATLRLAIGGSETLGTGGAEKAVVETSVAFLVSTFSCMLE